MNPDEIFESLTIDDGGLGPLNAVSSPINIPIRPLTIFIGSQGTGKSLVSQMLYFFRDAEYLTYSYFEQKDVDPTVRRILDGIRSGDLTGRALASFLTTKNAHVTHRTTVGNSKQPYRERRIGLFKNNRKISPQKQFRKEVKGWLDRIAKDPSSLSKKSSKAMFIPAERTFYSRFINASPSMLGNSALPITMLEFSRHLTRAAEIHQLWQESPESEPKESRNIDRIVNRSLGGRAQIAKSGPYSRKWQWIPTGSESGVEIEMASSGQMGAWPLVASLRALFHQPLEQRIKFIHIEEPETHLHPAAQVDIVSVLAYLINQGFHVTVTTHSLEVLLAFNNLVTAYQKLDSTVNSNNVPPPQLRLNPDLVAAYGIGNNQVKR